MSTASLEDITSLFDGVSAIPRTAAMLCDVPELTVIYWARSGRIRSETKSGNLVVRCDDVAREAAR